MPAKALQEVRRRYGQDRLEAEIPVNVSGTRSESQSGLIFYGHSDKNSDKDQANKSGEQ